MRLTDRRLRPAQEWEAAARSRISDLAARAARPVLGPVPASAEAVLFLDRSELLACLARDWSDGLIASCWWWRALFRATDEAGAVVRAWRETPEHVPAACQLLLTWRRLIQFVDRLPPADIVTLTRDLARTFGLEPVDRALAARSGAAPSGSDPGDSWSAGRARQIAGARASAQAGAVLTRYVPELARASLAPEPRVLILVALILHRAPSEARRILSATIVDAALAHDAEPRPPIAHGVPPSSRPVAGPRAGSSDSTLEVTEDAPANLGADAHEAIDAHETEGAHETGESPAVRLCESDNRFAETFARPAAAVARQADGVESPPPAPRPVEEIVDTEFGGAFYLINVAIAFGLYGDFTTPRATGIDLPIWDFIALIAERLAVDDTLATDPILPFLARLAGRDPAEPPGAGFVPPQSGESPETLDRWVDWLASRIAARVARSLGAADEQAGPMLLRHAARVSLSPSHLDVAFSLQDHPVGIRLAGLDRDPGFVPAAGLTVTFSYV